MFTLAIVIFFGLIVFGLDEVTLRDFVIGIGTGSVVFGIIGVLS